MVWGLGYLGAYIFRHYVLSYCVLDQVGSRKDYILVNDLQNPFSLGSFTSQREKNRLINECGATNVS